MKDVEELRKTCCFSHPEIIISCVTLKTQHTYRWLWLHRLARARARARAEGMHTISVRRVCTPLCRSVCTHDDDVLMMQLRCLEAVGQWRNFVFRCEDEDSCMKAG